jgi:hypothetical protein
MNSLQEARPQTSSARILFRLFSIVAVFALALISFGCGQSAEEKAKEDEAGKKANEQGMQRMLQEQTGQVPAQPGAAQPGGAGTPTPVAPAPGTPGK